MHDVAYMFLYKLARRDCKQTRFTSRGAGEAILSPDAGEACVLQGLDMRPTKQRHVIGGDANYTFGPHDALNSKRQRHRLTTTPHSATSKHDAQVQSCQIIIGVTITSDAIISIITAVVSTAARLQPLTWIRLFTDMNL